MKKMKKLLAVLLTLAMVVAMNLTSFAAEAPAATATITVNGLTKDDNTTLKLYQVVTLDVENSTWVKAEWVETLETSLGKTLVNLEATPIVIDWNTLKANVTDAMADQVVEGVDATTYSFNNLAVGAYMITAGGDTTQYNVMGSGTYDYDANNHLIVPVSKTISAKGSGYTVVKTLKDSEQEFVAKGDTVNFYIDTVFPSYPDEETNRVFTITDKPTGMKVTAVKVSVNNVEVAVDEDYTVTELGVADKEVTIAFTEAFIGTENEYATQNVRVEVTAVVTSEDAYSNEAGSNFDSTPSEVTGDVGSLTIKKVDENGNALKGAKFEITLDGTLLTFAPTVTAGVYDLVAGATATSSTDTTQVESPESGVIVLRGLGAGTYEIEEAEAPAGYKVVSVEDVTIAEGENADVEISVVNTKLTALPSTGGIGTTIFTIGGCGIMIAAAYLFFVSRRKEA